MFMSAFGECVVRTDPSGSHALLMTQVVSPEETAALKAVVPAFSSCVPAQRTLSFDKTVIRGAVALNYYRLAKALPGPREAAK